MVGAIGEYMKYSRKKLKIIKLNLDHINFPIHLKGYEFLKYCLLYLLNDSNVKIIEIYEITASEFNTQPYCVEKNIRRAIEYYFSRGNYKCISILYGDHINFSVGKLSNGKFMRIFCNNIEENIWNH